MDVNNRVASVKDSLKNYPNVKIIAATKYMDVEQTQALANAGITRFGENRTDMFLEKYDVLKNVPNIEWHFFGTLQTRKIKDIVNKIDYLHSLDRISLAIELDKKLTKPLNCFVQVNISDEVNKQGIPVNKVKSFVKQLEQYKNINVVGLMCINVLTFDEEVLRKSFEKMKKLQEEVISLKIPNAPCTELSMGMSNDYKIAVEYGATMVRLGRVFII